MKTQIRRGAFETNSSSTHAINIYRGSDYEIPKSIIVRPGEFGWECTTFNSPEDKLSYLYTWCASKCHIWETNEVTGHYESHYDYKKLKDYQYRIKSKLEALGVEEIDFETLSGWSYEYGYIDHSEDLYDNDLENILENYFEDFIFNHASYIETGNDNDDSDVCEDGSADFSIYKGN